MFNLEEIKAAFHGGLDDAHSFLHAQFSALRADVRDLRNSVDALDIREEWIRRPASGDANAAGTLNLEVGGPRPGYVWVVTRLTVVVAGGVGSSAVVYSGAVAPENAVATIDDADFYASDVVEVPVFQGGKLVVSLIGAPANAHVIATGWGRELRNNE